jgi:hypothetical protein
MVQFQGAVFHQSGPPNDEGLPAAGFAVRTQPCCAKIFQVLFCVAVFPVRDLSRKRMQLVQCRTAQILAAENLFSRHTGGQMQGERVKRLDETQVNGFGFAPDVTLAMQANLAVMQILQRTSSRRSVQSSRSQCAGFLRPLWSPWSAGRAPPWPAARAI